MPSNRSLAWFTTIANAQTVTTGGQSANALLTNLDLELHKGATVTRMIVQLFLLANTIDILGRIQWGIVLVNRDAADVVVFPDPGVANDRADWLVRGAESLLMSDINDGSQAVRVSRDLRAQRMLRDRQATLQFVIDQGASGMTVTYDLFVRVLIRLP